MGISCWKLFDVTNLVKFGWMTCDSMKVAALHLETKLQKLNNHKIPNFHLGRYIVVYMVGYHV